MNGASVVAQRILESAAEQQPPPSPQKSLVSCALTGLSSPKYTWLTLGRLLCDVNLSGR